MFLFAVGTWACVTAVVIVVLWLGVRHARCALIAFAIMFSLTALVRQPMFFMGLDAPHPQTHFEPTEWALICTANLALFAWVSIFLLSYWGLGRPAHAFRNVFPARVIGDERQPSNTAVLLAASVPFAFSVGGTVLLAAHYGGFGALAFAVKVSKSLEGLYVIRVAASLACIMACYGLLQSLRDTLGSTRRFTALSYLYICMIAAACATVFAWGNRFDIGTLLLALLVTFHFYVRRVRLVEVVVFCVVAAAFFEGLKLLRLSAFSEVVGRDLQAHHSFWLSISLSLHAAEFDAFMLALRDTGTLFDFRWGADFLNGLLSWVPRSIYPEKETYHIGGWFRRLYEPWTVNGWPITTVGSWYVNFGPVGIVLGAILSGFVFRMFDEAFSRSRSNPWHAAIAPALAFFTLQAGVAQEAPQQIVLFYLPLHLVAVWIFLTSRRHIVVSGRREPRAWQRPVGHGLA